MDILQPQREKIQAICRRYHVRRMSLFGSASVGPERPKGDIDLLVEFEPGLAPSGFELVDMQAELAEVFGGRGCPHRISEHSAQSVASAGDRAPAAALVSVGHCAPRVFLP